MIYLICLRNLFCSLHCNLQASGLPFVVEGRLRKLGWGGVACSDPYECETY